MNEYKYGEDVGYTLTDFTYPGELTCQAGETITSVLDKIKNVLGNYEYFYDINGKFIFQEVKNYLNTSYSTELAKQIANNENFSFDYYMNSPVKYDFSDGELIQSYQNTPQYQQIKNDFLIWGERQTATGQKIPIRYHLAIDASPVKKFYYFFDVPENKVITYDYKKDLPTKPNNTNSIFYIKEENAFYKWLENEDGYTGYRKRNLTSDALCQWYVNRKNFPKKGSAKKGYYYFDQQTQLLYKWDEKKQEYFLTHSFEIKLCTSEKPNTAQEGIVGRYYYKKDSEGKNKVYVCDQKQNGEKIFNQLNDIPKLRRINHISTVYYLEGLISEKMGLETNEYFSELKAEWPKLWDLWENKMYETVQKGLSGIDYFLNILDTSSLLNDFNISHIGRRTEIISNASINCIFEPQCPNIMFFDNNPPIEVNQTFSEQTFQRQQYQTKTKSQKEKDLSEYNKNHLSNYIPIYLDHSIFQYLKLGGILRSAYEEIRSELYRYVTYNEQVSIGILPIFYLEPNIIVKLFDPKTGINGNFLIKSFSIPLDINSNMSLTCTKAITRI